MIRKVSQTDRPRRHANLAENGRAALSPARRAAGSTAETTVGRSASSHRSRTHSHGLLFVDWTSCSRPSTFDSRHFVVLGAFSLVLIPSLAGTISFNHGWTQMDTDSERKDRRELRELARINRRSEGRFGNLEWRHHSVRNAKLVGCFIYPCPSVCIRGFTVSAPNRPGLELSALSCSRPSTFDPRPFVVLGAFSLVLIPSLDLSAPSCSRPSTLDPRRFVLSASILLPDGLRLSPGKPRVLNAP